MQPGPNGPGGMMGLPRMMGGPPGGPGGMVRAPGGPGGPGLPGSGPGGPGGVGGPPSSGPFNGANVQVKASAPNTIQYLPARPQTTAPSPRGPPSLEFLQRFTHLGSAHLAAH